MEKQKQRQEIEAFDLLLYQAIGRAQALADATEGRVAERLSEVAGSLRRTRAMLRIVRYPKDINNHP